MNFLICNAIFLLERVKIGSLEHLLPVLYAIVFSVLLIRYAKFKLHRRRQEIVIHTIAIIVSLTVVIFHLNGINSGNYNLSEDLPLYLCSILGIIIPIFTYFRRFWMYEILLFWIIAGTLQGVITPDIPDGFPTFDYFRYWTVHLGLLIIILYATFVFNMRPKLKSVFRSFFALQLYVVVMITINYALNANYFYLNMKPQSASLLDYFGDWPYYIIVVQLIIIPYFLLIYLPFYLTEKRLDKF